MALSSKEQAAIKDAVDDFLEYVEDDLRDNIFNHYERRGLDIDDYQNNYNEATAFAYKYAASKFKPKRRNPRKRRRAHR